MGDIYWIIGLQAIECKKGSKTWVKGRLAPPLIFYLLIIERKARRHV